MSVVVWHSFDGKQWLEDWRKSKRIERISEILKEIGETRAREELEARKFRDGDLLTRQSYEDEEGVPDVDMIHWIADGTVSTLKKELSEIISAL